ncbi:MAG: hypothetical protein DHS20C15_03910 [Planctomycetota bacterium]|nr:MAG: hypothetical protein DHS20C15_03910 [Planctomycetota bacterium]
MLALILSASACATYEPAPLDPSVILKGLRALSVPDSLPEPEPRPAEESASKVEREAARAFDASNGLSVVELIALGVTYNPELAASRAAVDVAGAQLVQAGLLPDPTVGWDLNEGNLQVALPLLRPDERDSREAVAESRIAQVRWELLRDEWQLARDVNLATLELLGVRDRAVLNAELERIAEQTQEFFDRAQSLGAATGLERELAAIQAADTRLRTVRLRVDERRAEQALNALIGLPPEKRLVLENTVALPTSLPEATTSAPEMTERALRERPDLQILLAAYQQTESELRLAVAQQWPLLSIGTTVQLTPGIFSDFNDPAIRSARLERERMARRVEAAVHEIRAEVHDAVAALEQSRLSMELLERELAPRLSEALRLVELSVQAGHVTASDVLLAQGQVLDAQVRMLDARIEAAKRDAVARWVAANTLEGRP